MAQADERRKVVTILFCDLVGSTALGESTDPEALRARMRRYFEDLRTIVERHGGTVEKFVGDAVMAVFGIPTAREDDALRAVRAACEMRDAIAEHGLEARIGIDTGEVVAGGDSETLVTGDAVNVAARLEQAAAAGETLIGARTHALVRDAAQVEPVEPLRLKGKSEPVEAFRLLGVVGDDAVVRRLETPLVGRRRERERLWRDYEDAVEDRACRLFTLLGPAGIGKSRLVKDFLERVGDEADVLRGRCLHYGEGITYWPLVEMLVPLGVDPESVVGLTPEETRVAFRRLVEARAAERPQVVVVDDVQWAEPVFVDLVEHVADLSRGAPIFMLCIARTEFLDARPDWAGGKLNATSLLLEPLANEEREALIDNLLGDASLDEGTRDRIAEASAGYPLYVEEMLAMVREQGGGEVTVPPTIQALLQARIDSLDGGMRVVLERGAVEGEVFHRGAVAELVPAELRGDVETHLSTLIRRELIWPERALMPDEDAYRFRHVLIRDAAYAAMPKELRAQLHESYAEWLERATTDATFELDEILAYHLEQAVRLRVELGLGGEDERRLARLAAGRLFAAWRAASHRGDVAAAASLLRRAVDLLPADDPARIEALPQLGHALMRVGAFEEAQGVLLEAIEAAGSSGDRASVAHAMLVLGDLRSRTDPEASTEEGLAVALELADELERLGDFARIGHAYRAIGMCRFVLGHAADGESDLERAAQLARSAGDVYGELVALTNRLRPVLWGPKPVLEGLDICESLLARDDVTVVIRVQAGQVRSMLAAMKGDVHVARSSAAEAIALAEEFGLGLQRALASTDIGYGFALLGDLDAAERELGLGHEALVAMGETGTRASLCPELANVLQRLGRDAEAMSFAEESRAIAGDDDLDAQTRWRAAMARIVSAGGDHAEAERLAREAVDIVASTDFLPLQADALDALGEVLARAGRVEEALDAGQRAIVRHEKKGNVVSAGRSRTVLNELRTARPS